MNPSLPMVGIDFGEHQVFGLQLVEVKAFADVLDDGASLRRAVVPLGSLLGSATTDGWQVAAARFPAEGVDHRGHIAGIDPNRIRSPGLGHAVPWPASGAHFLELAHCK